MSIENPTLAHFRHFSSLFTPSVLYNCRGFSTNQLFYAKQTQFPKKSNEVSFFYTMDYENKSDWTLGENKPNSNPNKPNLRRARMNVNLTLTKDYRKKDDFAVRINKPKTKPISSKAKMNANVFVTKDYENETAFRPQKNKPKQSQFQIQSSLAKTMRFAILERLFYNEAPESLLANQTESVR